MTAMGGNFFLIRVVESHIVIIINLWVKRKSMNVFLVTKLLNNF